VEGIDPSSRLHATLMQDLPTLDMDEAREQVVAAGRRLCQRHPELDTLVLECTNLPPYAEALRAATGLEVLDVLTLLRGRMAALYGHEPAAADASAGGDKGEGGCVAGSPCTGVSL
jgi:hypothetical protein